MKTIIITITAISIFAIIFLMGINHYELAGYKNGYAVGYEDAWNKSKALVDSSMVFSEKITTNLINGKIKSMAASDKTLTIEADPISLNPLSEYSKSTIRLVKILPETKIIKINIANQKEIQKMSNITNNNSNILLNHSSSFSQFTEQELTFDKLKIGQRITIIADKNIKNEITIIATKIEFLEN